MIEEDNIISDESARLLGALDDGEEQPPEGRT